MSPLPLDSELWKEVPSFFGDSTDLPSEIISFQQAVKSPEVLDRWHRLRDYFFYHPKIKESAIYAVPHISSLVPQIAPAVRAYVVMDLVDVKRFSYAQEFRHIESKYMLAFNEAITSTFIPALDALPTVMDKGTFQYYLGTLAVLAGHPDVGEFIIGDLTG